MLICNRKKTCYFYQTVDLLGSYKGYLSITNRLHDFLRNCIYSVKEDIDKPIVLRPKPEVFQNFIKIQTAIFLRKINQIKLFFFLRLDFFLEDATIFTPKYQ